MFAYRHEGVNLAISRALFKAAPQLGDELTSLLLAKPTSAFARRAWLLFEAFTGRQLDLPDIAQGNYKPLLDPRRQVVGATRKIRRQRIDLNTLGTLDFSPFVRRTEPVAAISGEEMHRRLMALVEQYDPALVRRALSYLYARETMASFEIEQERPPRDRAERFIALLQRAPSVARLNEATLLELQAALVDERFSDDGWRNDQNYVGEALNMKGRRLRFITGVTERVHYISPRPEELPELMDEWMALPEQFVDVEPVIAAATLSFTFVLLYPFSDGNGRIHRWLLHWYLARHGVTPAGHIIPVSAVMLSRRAKYDASLESFSRPLMPLLDYKLDEEGILDVEGDSSDFYRHVDLTPMVEALARWLAIAVDEEFSDELAFLLGLDTAREGIRELVDMPDRKITLFIQLVQSNGGKLSKLKRKRHFSMLTTNELSLMEDVVNAAFRSD